MSLKTLIGWTQATVNFWWGCTEVSPACVNCYAREWAKYSSRRLFGYLVEWGNGKPRAERLQAARKEAIALERKAVKEGVRIRVFANSMSDWLDDWVPIQWLAFLLETIRLTPHLDWQLLTKRPQNWQKRLEAVVAIERMGSHQGHIMAYQWLRSTHESDVPPNVWIGTTVEDQTRANERIPHLLQIPAKIRFLSCEPLVGPVNLCFVGGSQVETPYRYRGNFWEVACENSCTFAGTEDDLVPDPDQSEAAADEHGTEWVCPECHCSSALVRRHDEDPDIHWVIVGGMSGHGTPQFTHPDWIRGIRDQCAQAGVAFFFKQWGNYIPAGYHATHLDPNKRYKATHWMGLTMLHAGKEATGNLLDNKIHEAFPTT